VVDCQFTGVQGWWISMSRTGEFYVSAVISGWPRCGREPHVKELRPSVDYVPGRPREGSS